MSIVTLALAKAQSKILQTIEDTLLQSYLDGAEDHAQRFLQRNVYADDAAYTAAQASITADATAAQAAFDTATATAAAMDAGFGQDATTAAANEALARAQASIYRRIYGMVVTPAYTQAIVLIVASWFINREDYIPDQNIINLPFGAQNILFPMRRQLGV